MSLEVQTYLVLLATLVLYFALPIWFLTKGWILRAGLVALVAALLPSIWQGIFWEESAGNFGLLIFVLAPLPLVIIGSGLVLAMCRAAKRVSGGRTD